MESRVLSKEELEKKYRLSKKSNTLYVEQKGNNNKYYTIAFFGEDSKITYYGELSDKECDEIDVFLSYEGIHRYPDGRYYTLSN